MISFSFALAPPATTTGRKPAKETSSLISPAKRRYIAPVSRAITGTRSIPAATFAVRGVRPSAKPGDSPSGGGTANRPGPAATIARVPFAPPRLGGRTRGSEKIFARLNVSGARAIMRANRT